MIHSANWLDGPGNSLAAASTARPFSCSSCGDSFARHDHLERHYRSHKQETPFPCDLCSRSYGRHDVLLRHRKKIHGIADKDDRMGRTQMTQKRRKLSSLQYKSVEINTEAFEGAETLFLDVKPPSEIDVSAAVVDRHPMSPMSPISRPEEDSHIYGYRLSVLEEETDAYSRPSIPQIPQPTHSLASISRGTIYDTMQHLDLRTFLDSYHEHSTPNVPFLHIPTLDFSDGALKQVLSPPDPRAECFPLSFTHGTSQQRPVHRALLLSLLTLGALYEDRPTFARALLNETNKAIRTYLLQVQKWACEPPLQLVQAFVHYIQASLYFGDQVLDELALGHICCLASLVRTARLSQPPRQAPEISDRRQWSHWAVAEERKRAFWGAFIIFASVLTYLDMPTSFLDVQGACLALPCHEDQWEAETGEEWKARSVSLPQEALFQSEISKLLAPSPRIGDIYDEVDVTVDSPSSWPSISEFGCLVLVLALQVRVWSWNEDSISAEGPSERERADLEVALKRWEALYRTFPSVSRKAPQLKVREIVLLSCLPIFDHAQLLLRVRIKDVKAAMHARDYKKACTEFACLKLVKEQESSLMDEFFRLDNTSDNVETSISEIQEVAKYAVRALDLSFQASPWLPAAIATDSKVKNVPIVCTLTLFHCVQIVSSWLLRAAQRLGSWAANREVGQENIVGGLSIYRSLESSELALVESVTDLVDKRRLDIGQLPLRAKSQQFAGMTHDDLSKLAVALLQIHAIMFETNFVQPIVSHLVKGLRYQADIVYAKLT